VAFEIGFRPVTADNLADLAGLFGGNRNTRHCWCAAFCSSSRQFSLGWFGGGNRRRFTELAAASDFPMGVLAVADDEPAGWCACGPRSRYMSAVGGRSQLLRTRPRDEDDSVWLIACLYVDARHRGHGIAHALVGAAVNLARQEDATAVEGWPTRSPAPSTADLFVGPEQLFLAQGFRLIDRPSPGRSIMRLDLRPGRPSRAASSTER
jgi:GNAT superfamily N-acetyltransferase